MKNLYVIFFLCCGLFSSSQTVSIDNSSYNANDLVDLLLNSSCIEYSNATFSSNQSVAYFNNNGGIFPISEGIVIRSGNVIDSQGLYTDTNLGSPTSNGGVDAFLQSLSDSSSGTSGSLTDLAYLQFDFTSISTSFNFSFLFASNEYGQYQCLSNDIFSFELIDQATGVITNLAVIPTTTTPVSVKTIKNSAYNNTCSSTNSQYFDTYNVSNPAASTINMRGHTIVLSAGSAIIPNHPYTLKMVIGDYVSSNYDSAVFISAGSFNTEFDLGEDQIICSGDEFLLDTGLDNTYTYQWLLNGNVIAGENNSTYTVNQPGIYQVLIDKGTCHIEDEIIFNPLQVNSPQDLFICDTGASTYPFDLTQNDINFLGLDSSIYQLFYYESPADITANNPIPASDLASFQSSGQTIYIKVFNTQTSLFCDATNPFDLIITPTITAGTNIIDAICNTPSELVYDLSQHNTAVINGQSGTFTITYHNTQVDAQNDTSPISAIANIPSGAGTITYWIRIEDSSNASCFDVTNVTITINPLPVVDTINSVVECTQYQLPTIVNGTYYLLPGGPTTPGQVQLNAGDIIDIGGTYYIFSGPDANGCTNESSFNLTFIDEYVTVLDYCETFNVPPPPYGIGGFYTDFGGPNGSGTLIPTGTEFTNNTGATIIQPIFYYAEINGVMCRDEQFDIYIHPNPIIDTPSDVISCFSYTLVAPTLGGSYYSDPNGTGTNYPIGHVINTSQIVYIYGSEPHVTSSGSNSACIIDIPFDVKIVNPNFQDVYACGEYYLTQPETGGYYTQPLGQGTQLDISQPITQNQTIYYYAQVTNGANCTDNTNFNVTIYPQPLIDPIDDGTFCGEYILPQNNGTYYMLSGGPTTPGQVQLNAGDIIDLTGGYSPGTYYVYNEETHNYPGGTITCINEDPFTITIEPFPGLNDYISSPECSPYSITQPTTGDIYTQPNGPNGTGSIIDYNQVYTTTETFYFYYEDPVNGCKIDKEFQRIYSALDLPNYPDVVKCNSYMLPPLNNPTPNPEPINSVGYYFNSGGNASDAIDYTTYVFTPQNTPQIVYVYGVNTDNHLTNCVEERSFVVTVLETPDLTAYNFSTLDDQNYCGNYTLPALPSGNFTINYYTQQGGDPANIINPNDYTFSLSSGDPAQTFDIWVYAENSGYDESTDSQTICFDEEHFQFTIYPRPTFIVEGGVICVHPTTNETIESFTLVSGLDSNDFDVEWYLNGNLVGTGVNYEAVEAGTYTAVPIKLTAENAPDCNYESTTVVVTQSSTAIASVIVSSPFAEVANATVIIENGFGNYIYELDDNQPQTSNEFYDLSSGEHIITIYDTLGNCGNFVLIFNVIKYPNFFTPNNDSFNDTWNIWDMRNDHPEAVISIFDRYGKLIKQISPLGNGWDGTYNGEKLPSSDYWFLVDYKLNGQDKQFKAHFSLKR